MPLNEDIFENSTGRPPVYDDPVEMQVKVNEYFENLPEESKPTITGLTLFLGFESRQSFYDYERRDNFSYTVKRSRLAIENVYEQRLQGNSPTGAIFALKNMGWKDSVEHDVTESTRNALSDLDKMIRKQADKERNNE